MFIDKKMSWDVHIRQLNKTRSKANGIFSNPSHCTSISTLISVYYPIFYSHLIYGYAVWSLITNKNSETIRILLNKYLRIMNFAEYISHTNPLFVHNNLIKIDDIIESSHLKIIFEYTHGNLPDDLNVVKLAHNIHNHHTRSVDNKGLFIPPFSTTIMAIIVFPLPPQCCAEWPLPPYWNPGPSTSSGGTGLLLGNPDVRVVATTMASYSILSVHLFFRDTPFQVVNLYASTTPYQREDFYSTGSPSRRRP